MKTVTEVSRLAGVSVKTLHHYDEIGLLKPTKVTEAGYRLYDEEALERLYLILVFRELGLSLKDIGDILAAPDHIRNRTIEQQIRLMQKKIDQLQNRITLAKGILLTGGNYMNLKGFDPSKLDDDCAQAKALYGKTEAYKEYEQKSRGRSREQENDLGDQVMGFFIRLGQMRPCAPDSREAQNWAKELQEFFTEHYYNCTPQMLQGLGMLYAGGGSMTENIDRVGGHGTGAFAKEVIDIYVERS